MDDKEKENVLNMSDEEFMQNYAGQASEKFDNEPSESEEETKEQPQEQPEEQVEEPKAPEPKEETKEPVEQNSTSEAKVVSNSNESSDVKSNNDSKDIKSDTIASEEAKLDYKALYEKLMAPFKADGKTIQLKNVDEAIALMQKGVNYTRKTQNLAKYQKSILSLENANLLDTQKLNNLINIYKGDKVAIKQLLAERKIDPMDLSSNGYDDDNADEVPSDYVPENNIPSDAEVRFKNTLAEVKDTKEGNAVINDLLKSDETTLSEIYKDPRLITTLVDQKNRGIYDAVCNEINRRKTIGLIGDDVPFIYSYYQVGTEMNNQLIQSNKGNIPLSGSAQGSNIQPPVRKNAKFSNANNAKARAAATTRSTPAGEPRYKNPLSMSDEEFMKTFGSRYK